jgi:hypothetical protein
MRRRAQENQGNLCIINGILKIGIPLIINIPFVIKKTNAPIEYRHRSIGHQADDK